MYLQFLFFFLIPKEMGRKFLPIERAMLAGGKKEKISLQKSGILYAKGLYCYIEIEFVREDYDLHFSSLRHDHLYNNHNNRNKYKMGFRFVWLLTCSQNRQRSGYNHQIISQYYRPQP